jgi:hypothetical protein
MEVAEVVDGEQPRHEVANLSLERVEWQTDLIGIDLEQRLLVQRGAQHEHSGLVVVFNNHSRSDDDPLAKPVLALSPFNLSPQAMDHR